GSYGVLAQPTAQPFVNAVSRGTPSMPIGSRRMWGSGDSETCPPRYAVRSPPRRAASPGIASSTVVANRNAANHTRPCVRSRASLRIRAVPRINEHYLNLQASYLFAEVKRRTQAFRDAHPEARVISLGIGDVTRPLPPAVVHALEQAAREQGRAETLKGYGPYVGYEFLRAEIAAHDFGSRGVGVTVDEIFISDGGKSDSANLQEIFAAECVVALMDPVYPVYADSNVIAGRSGRADERGRYAGF